MKFTVFAHRKITANSQLGMQVRQDDPGYLGNDDLYQAIFDYYRLNPNAPGAQQYVDSMILQIPAPVGGSTASPEPPFGPPPPVSDDTPAVTLPAAAGALPQAAGQGAPTLSVAGLRVDTMTAVYIGLGIAGLLALAALTSKK